MVWEENDEECEKLLLRVIEALPRLKQYRLSQAQKAFIERFEEMVEHEKRQASLMASEVVL
jgi:hypothetical protein